MYTLKVGQSCPQLAKEMIALGISRLYAENLFCDFSRRTFLKTLKFSDSQGTLITSVIITTFVVFLELSTKRIQIELLAELLLPGTSLDC